MEVYLWQKHVAYSVDTKNKAVEMKLQDILQSK